MIFAFSYRARQNFKKKTLNYGATFPRLLDVVSIKGDTTRGRQLYGG